MLKHYCIIAWRNIIKQKFVGAINIGGLSIAMAIFILVFIWVQNELSFDAYHNDRKRIYLLKNTWQVDKTVTWIEQNSFYPLAEAIEKNVPEVEMVTRMEKIGYDGSETISADGKIFKFEKAINVDKNWFNVFKYTFKEGSASAFYSNLDNIILSESKARAFFGDESAIGKQVYINSKPLTVSAIIKDNPNNSSFQFDILKQFEKSDPSRDQWLYLWCKTFVKLKKPANQNTAEKKINDLVKSNSTADGSITVSLLPLKGLHFANDFETSAFRHVNIKSIFIFSALAFLLLLTASINFVNLSLARITVRLKEISIRKIAGAGKIHLFMQLMSESLVTGFIALPLSAILAYFCLPLLKTFSGIDFNFNPFDPAVIFVLTSTFIFIIILTGLYPALLISNIKPASIFKGYNIAGVKNSSLKKVFITVQFIFAIFLIVATIVILQQLIFIQKQDVTYNRQQVFTVKIPWVSLSSNGQKDELQQEHILRSLKFELLSTGYVQTAARSQLTSLSNENNKISNGLDWDGKPENFNPEYVSYSVEADINNIMHFKMIEGRWFDDNNVNDKNNIILNETAVKKFGIKQPLIGKRFNKGVIIGIIKDFFHQDLHEKIGPLVIRTGSPNSANFIIQSKPGHVQDVLNATGLLWKKYFPGSLFEYSFADEEFANLYKNDRAALKFILLCSIVCILMCSVGLLGMVIFMAEQRRKEIGIRKVIGATINGIVLLLTKDFVKIAFIAFIIASPIAWWAMNKWLEEFVYRVHISWWMFAAAGIIALLIAIATISFQAIKAAMANPVKSLRTE